MIGGVVCVGDHHKDGVKLEQDEAAPEAEKVEDGEEQLQPETGLAKLLYVGIMPIAKELGQWIPTKVYYYLLPNNYNYSPSIHYQL